MKGPFRYLLPAIAWLIVCTILFTLPGKAFPKKDWLDDIYFDKWVHIGIISILVFLTVWGVYRFRGRRIYPKDVMLWILIGTLYGLLMEFVQLYFVANRSFDGGDVIADLAGAVLGGGYGWWKYRETGE